MCSAWREFIRAHNGPFKEKLTFSAMFPICMKFPHFVHYITLMFHNLFFSTKVLEIGKRE